MAKVNIFNSKDALLLAAMCFQTYGLFEKGKLVLPKEFRRIYTIRADSGVKDGIDEVFGFVAESKDNIVVAFRGTDSLQDLYSDKDVFQVSYPFVEHAGRTHRGVTGIYHSTRNQLIREINRLSTRKKLLITGHSLGGAIATLFALDVAVNTRFKNPFLYTLASFRVGSSAFASRFNKTVKRSVRIANVHDPIPRSFVKAVYPPPFSLFYKHVKSKFPLNFQLNNMLRNHSISCYFHNLSKKNPAFAKVLCKANPGFCPDTSICKK